MPSAKPTVGINDLESQFPQVAREAFGWDPSEVRYGSSKIKEWICPQGHIYECPVKERTGKKKCGCPFCSANRILEGFNDLKSLFPTIASEALGWDPSFLTSGSSLVKEWQCPRGHVYQARVKDRTGDKKCGCPVCSGQQFAVGINDLKTQFPDIAQDAFGWDASKVNPGSKAKRAWKCGLGHVYYASPNNRTTHESGCPYCANKMLMLGFNDLLSRFPEIAAETDGWDPQTVISGSHVRKKWKCKEGHSWTATVVKRTTGRGCPTCSKGGFSPDKPAWFYLMQRPGEQQLGITNVPSQRIATHERNGWSLIEMVGPKQGHEVLAVEILFKRWLRNNIGLIHGTEENWQTILLEVHSLSDLKQKSGIATDLF